MPQQISPGIGLEQTDESPPSSEDAKQAEPELTGPAASSHLPRDDVESTRSISMIKDGARTSSPLSFSPPSASLRLQPQHHSGPSSLVTTERRFPSREGSPEVTEIASPQNSVKNQVNLSPRPTKTSERTPASTSPSPSPSTPTSRVRIEVHPHPNPATGATYKFFSTVPPQPRSSPTHISNDAEPPVSKRRKTHHHHISLAARAVSNPRSRRHLSSPTSSVKTSASRVDPDTPSTLEYDLDRDPTQQALEFRDHFQERSPYSAMLSARFIHDHLFEALSGPTTSNNEPTNSEGDLVTEFTDTAALNSAGSHDAVNPFVSTELFGNPDPAPPSYGDLDLEGPVHVADPFTALTIDDVINHQPWGPDPEPAINPSLIGGTPTFSEPRSPSPAPTFRDFHSWKRPRTPSPSPTQLALRIQLPPSTLVSTIESNSTKAPRDYEANLGGGKAKFYKKGTLQAPPHLSNSQRRRSVSAKTAESIHTSHHLSPDQAMFAEMDSPLTEFSASGSLARGIKSTSSLTAPRKAIDSTDEGSTITGHRSDAKTGTTRKQQSSTNPNQKGPYRIVAVNEIAFCHQCRRSSPHPKMRCRACTKQYCILCIVKRYHGIEFHQFRKNFDCPACLDTCNCTACCYKREEVYVSSRHVKLDRETMAKLLSGEIRSLPHLSVSLVGPHGKLKPEHDPISSKYKGLPLTSREERKPARRKGVSSRRHVSHDDYESDGSKAQNAGARVKPAQATLQTQRMLEESGSGRYWGAVYSLSGERIGMSYVGNDLQNVTLRTTDSPSASMMDYSPSPSQRRRGRVYVGRWQNIWGTRPESLDDLQSEGEAHANQRGRNKELGRARCYYVGNPNLIGAWRKAQFKAVPIPSSDDIDIHALPSDPPSFDKSFARDQHETTGVLPNDGIPVDGEGEDEDGSGSFWIIEDELSPKRSNLPPLTTTGVSRSGQDDIINVLNGCPTPTLESCGRLVTREGLVKAVASGLQAVGTAVLLPGLSLSPPSNS